MLLRVLYYRFNTDQKHVFIIHCYGSKISCYSRKVLVYTKRKEKDGKKAAIFPATFLKAIYLLRNKMPNALLNYYAMT